MALFLCPPPSSPPSIPSLTLTWSPSTLPLPPASPLHLPLFSLSSCASFSPHIFCSLLLAPPPSPSLSLVSLSSPLLPPFPSCLIFFLVSYPPFAYSLFPPFFLPLALTLFILSSHSSTLPPFRPSSSSSLFLLRSLFSLSFLSSVPLFHILPVPPPLSPLLAPPPPPLSLSPPLWLPLIFLTLSFSFLPFTHLPFYTCLSFLGSV